MLAVAAEERVETLPDAQTFKELGYDIVGWAYRGVAAPKGTCCMSRFPKAGFINRPAPADAPDDVSME